MSRNKTIKLILLVTFLTTFLTWFFYVHENLPKPLRVLTALIESPVAIASGISYYLNLEIPVYETFWAIILSNLVFSICFVLVIQFIINRRNRQRSK